MRVMRHAALHAQQQHIVWQQVIMKVQNTSPAGPLSKEPTYKDWMRRIEKSNQ
jgi:hypothetical protein